MHVNMFLYSVVFLKIKASLGSRFDWFALTVVFASVLRALMAAVSKARTDVTHYTENTEVMTCPIYIFQKVFV